MDKHQTTNGGPDIPPQQEGKQLDLEARAVLPSEQQAFDFFEQASRRLLDVNNWYEVAELPLSTFVLTDAEGGEAIKSRPAVGDKVRIDIPGPGPQAGEGYDWVAVEEVIERPGELCSITLRPAKSPQTLTNRTAHFFKDTATSTLILERRGREVVARYHGRNEVANTDTDSLIDNARNAVVGIGAKLGLSYPQWKSLIEGVVKVMDETNNRKK